MEWQKTTFGELKAGDWYSVDEPRSYMAELHRRATDSANDDETDVVYRLVVPEREALEKIRDEYLNLVRTSYRAEYGDEINDEKAHDMAMGIKMYAIATAALEVKE